jgi:uncharacterized DUF497 family protein
MLITWDEPKRLANLAKHGVDFADLDEGFFLGSRVRPTRHGRFQAIGHTDGSILSVVFAPLGREAIAIISARPESRTERKIL